MYMYKSKQTTRNRMIVRHAVDLHKAGLIGKHQLRGIISEAMANEITRSFERKSAKKTHKIQRGF